MCEGFGGIVTMDGRVLFAEPDSDGDCSHSELLKRLGMKDNDKLFPRHFVRFEFPKWTEESFRFDEQATLPGWVNEEHIDKAKKVLGRVAPARAEYQKVRAPARAEYEKVRDAARAEYDKVHDAAWAECDKVHDAARAEYQKVCDAAWAEYQKVWDAAKAEFINTISGITGYTPK